MFTEQVLRAPFYYALLIRTTLSLPLISDAPLFTRLFLPPRVVRVLPGKNLSGVSLRCDVDLGKLEKRVKARFHRARVTTSGKI